MEFQSSKLLHPHYFLRKIVGKSMCTALARLEIKGEKLVYPILISETIEGEPFNETSSSNLDKKHLSWQLIARILYRPGDESLPNLIKALNRIYCCDNDIAFVEPIEQGTLSDTINFNSALFCLDDFDIESEVIDQYLELMGDLITHDWLQDLEKEEKENLKLFTKEELVQFYNSFGFTPTILFRKGTIATLCLQFTHLKIFLENKKKENLPVKASELLSTLITLHNDTATNTGSKVARAYDKARTLPTLQERLTKASGDQGKSRTTVEARRISLNAIPTAEEIEKKEKYSIEKAWLEIISLMDIERFVTFQEKKLFVDFSKVTIDGKADTEHQTLILKAVQLFLSKRNIKPSKVILWHCAVLDKKILTELLHEGLTHLDLRHCPTLTNEDIVTIEKTCPTLEELYLSGCEKITAIEKGKKELAFPELKVLHAADGSLKSLRINIPKIEELRIDKNPILTQENVIISPLWIDRNVKYYGDFVISQNLYKYLKLDSYDGLFFSDKRLAAQNQQDGTLKIWDLKTLECVLEIKAIKEWKEWSCNGIIQLRNGNIVTISNKYTYKEFRDINADYNTFTSIKVWNNRSEEISNLELEVVNTQRALFLSSRELTTENIIELPDGRLAFGFNKKINIWNFQKNERVLLSYPSSASSKLMTISIGIDGRLAFVDDYGKVILWDLNTNEHIILDSRDSVWSSNALFLQLPDKTIIKASQRELTQNDGINTVSSKEENIYRYDENWLLSDGKLARRFNNNKIKVWDLQTGKYLYSLNLNKSRLIYSMTPLSNGKFAIGFDFGIKIFDINTGQCIREINNKTYSVIHLSQYSDEQIISYGGTNMMKRYSGRNGLSEKHFCLWTLPQTSAVE